MAIKIIYLKFKYDQKTALKKFHCQIVERVCIYY